MTYAGSQAEVARGITVKILIAGRSEQTIGEVCTDGVPIPQTSVDDIEVTNQDSGDWKEFKSGRKDGGECEVKCNAVDGDLGQAELAYGSANGSTALITVTYPSGSTQTFNAVIKSYDHTVDGDILKITSKLKVSGEPSFSTTASALTGLTATGETLVPVYGASVFRHTVTIAAADTEIVFVPVQAASGAVITVNGTAVASGGNGTVAIGAAGTTVIKDVPIVVKELSKAAKVYDVTVIRPAA
jgi:hypothetical protein